MKKLLLVVSIMLLLTVGCKSKCEAPTEEVAPVETPAEVLQ